MPSSDTLEIEQCAKEIHNLEIKVNRLETANNNILEVAVKFAGFIIDELGIPIPASKSNLTPWEKALWAIEQAKVNRHNDKATLDVMRKLRGS